MNEEQQLEALRDMVMKALGLSEGDITIIKGRSAEQDIELARKKFAPYFYQDDYRLKEVFEQEFPTMPNTYIWPEGVKQL